MEYDRAVKICIVSDSHDRAEPLAAAVRAAAAQGAEVVIHCGDVIGTQTLRAALALDLPMHVIHGNNLGDPAAMMRMAFESGGRLTYHGQEADVLLGGRRIYVTHYPHIAHAMACAGDHSLVCCGHSHVAEVRQQRDIKGGATWLVNPGTVAGLSAPPTWVLGDLTVMSFAIRTLDGDR